MKNLNERLLLISNKIRTNRKRLGMTQQELANYLRIKKNSISNYENGYSTPSVRMLIKIADIFQITLDELVGRNFK